ncbi:MAG: hypothetical protein Q9227_004055 [Pyrenula ochraceoflavens]
MTAANKRVIAIVNGTGRQAASLIRVVSAVGFSVRAQVYSRVGLVAEELAALPGVELFEGDVLKTPSLVKVLFAGAHYAFINTTYLQGDEVKIGKLLADTAKKCGTIRHYIYSSMPDHAAYNPRWPSLPLWACKATVENYIRQIGLPATFVITGIYNNNFTTLPYPLFCLEHQPDGSLIWRAPFHSDVPLPWLDAEHDVGPAVLQIIKDGPKKWSGHRIALAFEMLTPHQVAHAFSNALQRPCNYIQTPNIEIRAKLPPGYREQLSGIEDLFGQLQAPYFPPSMFLVPPEMSDSSQAKENKKLSGSLALTDEARQLWEGWRGIEEYAGEAFLAEEEANGTGLIQDMKASSA